MDSVSKTKRIFLYVQFLIVVFGILNAVFQLVDGDYRSLFLQPTVCVNLVAYIGILLYAFWGYRKSVVPMTVAVCALVIALVISTDRELRLAQISVVSVLFLLAAAVAMVVFLNTFKKHKIAGMTSSVVAVVLCLGWGILNISGTEGGRLLARQPLDYFFIASAIATTYAVRCSWSRHGKEDILFI